MEKQMLENVNLKNIDYNELKRQICFREINVEEVSLIAGVDVAYANIDNIEYGICSILLFDFTSFELIDKVNSYVKVDAPYKPGMLGLHELPVIFDAYKKLSVIPDIFMLDGNGYLHKNHLGIATMFSCFTNVPSIGVAKSYYNVGEDKWEMPDNSIGSISYLKKDKEIYGVAMRSRVNCKPVYVSVGNYISLDNAIDITRRCLNDESRIPIPTRLADIDTHIERKKFVLRKCRDV